MLKYGIDVQCDVLKASHHGSNSSTGNEFLDAARPAYCVISCEADSMYGFPTEQVMSRLHNRNIKTYVTYLDGDIIFNTTEMSVSAKK